VTKSLFHLQVVVLVVTAFLVAYFVRLNLYVAISMNKTRKNGEKLTDGPNDACRIVWARSRRLRLP
jgi:hypothetical protein